MIFNVKLSGSEVALRAGKHAGAACFANTLWLIDKLTFAKLI